MEVINYKTKSERKLVVGLGFFDAVHLGHKYLLERVSALAKSVGCKTAVFTFSNNILSYFSADKEIFTFEERLRCFRSLGLDCVLCAEFDQSFRQLDGRAFIESLCDSFNISAFVVGSDYKFGKDAACGIDVLRDICEKRNVKTEIVDFVNENEADKLKISSSTIRRYLQDGDIERANSLMSERYFVCGEVEHCVHRGSSLGFPTANLKIDAQKQLPKEGVYLTSVDIDGIAYFGLTNVGGRPTFDNVRSIETFILDFSGDIYGKTIVVSFLKRLRDTQKFPNSEAFVSQLKTDIAISREIIKGFLL